MKFNFRSQAGICTFYLSHLSSLKNQRRGLPHVGVVDSSKVIRTGSWSLYNAGPKLSTVLNEIVGEENVKSMVDGLPVEGSILVPKSRGVSRATSGNSMSAVQMEMPSLFELESDSHMAWYALKSPPMINGLLQKNKRKISSAVLSPFEVYAEIKSSVGEVDVDI